MGLGATADGFGKSMNISPTQDGEFAAAIRRTVERFKPKYVIETGTHTGEGTTRVLFESLYSLGADHEWTLVTIEAARKLFMKAADRYRKHPEVVCLHGLSIPKTMLPTREQIQALVIGEQIPDIYYDHDPKVRVDRYLSEQASYGPHELLRVACAAFEFKPDLVLLDSAGHLGFIEFEYLMSMVKGPFVLVLDDIRHVKHHRTWESIKSSEHWEILEQGDERFGWGIARRLSMGRVLYPVPQVIDGPKTSPAPVPPPDPDRGEPSHGTA